MGAPPSPADRIAATAPCRIVGCERVVAGSAATLLRVTVALQSAPPRLLTDARLVVAEGDRQRRVRPLAAPVPADCADELSLGFVVGPTAMAHALELDDRVLTLPAPTTRVVGTAGAAATRRELEAALREARQQLSSSRASLEEMRCASVRIELERDEARRAATRAEAAAYDATVRAAARAAAPTAHDAASYAELAKPDRAPDRRVRRVSRRAAGTGCGLGCAALVAGLLFWPAGDGTPDRVVAAAAAAGTPAQPEPDTTDRLARQLGIPAGYLDLYRRAAERYGLDWTRLAAVGAIESRHGQARAAGVTSGVNHRGASGPAQFLAGTWERFGLDGDGDGIRDPHNPADAIPAMASYLRASGAPQDWRRALRSYNHSDAYVTAVEQLAASYRSASSPS